MEYGCKGGGTAVVGTRIFGKVCLYVRVNKLMYLLNNGEWITILLASRTLAWSYPTVKYYVWASQVDFREGLM